MNRKKLDVTKLRDDFFKLKPDPEDPAQKVSFGTSGHRGCPSLGTFNEMHIAAIAQSMVDFRKENGINGVLFIGMDTHAASLPAMQVVLEVLAANDAEVRFEERQKFDDKSGFTPTPAVSFAILEENKNDQKAKADGIIITPSHNPPADGGIKYNPPTGGPADSSMTKKIGSYANNYLKGLNAGVKRIPLETALKKNSVRRHDFVTPYVSALKDIIDMDAVKSSKIKIGADPLGGAAIEYLEPIKKLYGIELEIINDAIDMTFDFMPSDHDGKIRMDCSSPFAMANVVRQKDDFDVIFANDTDSDRHGIVARSKGLLNPNHFLSVAVWYLINHRAHWEKGLSVGKTIVTTQLIERIVSKLGRMFLETPVGFKYFADGLFKKTLCFGGEESAGASFLRMDGSTWTTDKDGIIMGLLAAEICAVMKKDPGIIYEELTKEFGIPFYKRIDTPASPALKKKLGNASPEQIKATTLAKDAIILISSKAPNGEPIGGLKISTQNGWSAVRPSGTEDIAKLYAESFVSEEHLENIISDTQNIIKNLV
ncbi:MAG: phosphoglucomutase, alpha-D-glucose phosphate-specific [Candidatus Saganbacteria bacterium]|nr:phosphoglucomutase, alpha-D-glucose phosphate-specific [Candidatus Saganbacteria bacterium]